MGAGASYCEYLLALAFRYMVPWLITGAASGGDVQGIPISLSLKGEMMETRITCVVCGVPMIVGKPLSKSAIKTLSSIPFWCQFCVATNPGRLATDYMPSERGRYKEYLSSPLWAAIRRVAIERAGGRCQVCNSDLLLQVHHRKYPEVLGYEEPYDLTVLCRRCHDLFHQVVA